jgi:phytanoyl-CoA hydroxylase
MRTRVKRAAKSWLGMVPKPATQVADWSREPTYELWFEQPDALDRIPGVASRWDLTRAQRDFMEQWVIEGYFIVPGLFPEVDVDRYAAEVESAWFAEKAILDMAISDVIVGDDPAIVHMQHADLLTLSESQRVASMEKSNWRIGEFHLFNQAARTVFDNRAAARLCSAIFDRPAVPHFSLTFSKGSRQLLHQDTCVFHAWPMNALIGMWLALEDIAPDSGPLVYYPRSHREALYHEFDNYPQTQRRTAPADRSDRYQTYVEETASRYERKEFVPKKGEALFWHGMLVHGGSQFVAPGTTRKSCVIHYLPEGGNVAHRVVGPFNW